MPLTHHYKKCPVMWMIIELISKNPEISLSSRNNPEMSQHSSDVPIVVKFSIYIFPWDLLWSGWYHLKYIFLHWVQCFSLYQNSLKNRKCLNFLMFLQGVSANLPHTLVNVAITWRKLYQLSCSDSVMLPKVSNTQSLIAGGNLVLAFLFGNTRWLCRLGSWSEKLCDFPCSNCRFQEAE